MVFFSSAGQKAVPFVVCVLLLGFIGTAARADQPSGEPQTSGGLGLFDALQKRSSAKAGDFSSIPVKDSELATVLWAATGRNRNGTGWVIPTYDGEDPYVSVFVAGSEGVFRFDGADNSLAPVTNEDVRGRLGHQSFVKKAYYVLIFVADSAALSRFSDAHPARDYALIAVGAMSQNVYLACAALKLDTRYISTIETEEIRSALKLADADEPLALMLLGK